MKRVYILLCFLLSFLMLSGQSEVIKNYHVDIEIDTSSDITVTETISVIAAGDIIKRGIYRALPLSREDKNGNVYPIAYTLLSVKQNGNRAVYHTEESSGYFKIYIGSRNQILRPGQYTYEIQYKTYGQIGYFEDFDEIYWNVNGTEWVLPAEKVSASVKLPNGADVLNAACYTGRLGSNQSNCSYTVKPNIEFSADNLRAKENLTIAVSFEKGFVAEPPPPTFWERFKLLIIGIGISLALLFYYVYTWMKYGVDPPKPVVYPVFEPPEGLSPAGVAAINKDKVRGDFVTTSIINLAVKGYLTIKENNRNNLLGMFASGSYTLTKIKNSDSQLPNEEKVLLDSLFQSSNSITLNGKYNSSVHTAMSRYEHELNDEYKGLIETGRNTHFIIIPILAMILFFFLTFFTGAFNVPSQVEDILFGGLFFLVFFSSIFIPVFMLIFSRLGRFKWWIFGIVIILFTIFVIPHLPKLDINIYVIFGFTIFSILSIILYKYLIERPSEEKLKLQSLVEGFKMYMGAAENNQIKHFNPPAITPEVFEKLLPYAIALGVDKVWGEKFQNYLKEAAINDYQSQWYIGNRYFSPNFYHVMNSSVSNTINATSTPPSQSGGGSWSSGSGGGGFSGGGGGGGGGGGW